MKALPLPTPSPQRRTPTESACKSVGRSVGRGRGQGRQESRAGGVDEVGPAGEKRPFESRSRGNRDLPPPPGAWPRSVAALQTLTHKGSFESAVRETETQRLTETPGRGDLGGPHPPPKANGGQFHATLTGPPTSSHRLTHCPSTYPLSPQMPCPILSGILSYPTPWSLSPTYSVPK